MLPPHSTAAVRRSFSFFFFFLSSLLLVFFFWSLGPVWWKEKMEWGGVFFFSISNILLVLLAASVSLAFTLHLLHLSLVFSTFSNTPTTLYIHPHYLQFYILPGSFSLYYSHTPLLFTLLLCLSTYLLDGNVPTSLALFLLPSYTSGNHIPSLYLWLPLCL